MPLEKTNSVCEFLQKRISEIRYVKPSQYCSKELVTIWKYLYEKLTETASRNAFSRDGNLFELDFVYDYVLILTKKKYAVEFKHIELPEHCDVDNLVTGLAALLDKYELGIVDDRYHYSNRFKCKRKMIIFAKFVKDTSLQTRFRGG